MIPAVALALDALRRGDPAAALHATVGVSDPVVLVLRGVASAEIGELKTGRALVCEAARAFETRDDVLLAERARLAEGAIALADDDVEHARTTLLGSARRLELLGDAVNCAWAFMLAAHAATLLENPKHALSLLSQCREKMRGKNLPQVEATLSIANAEIALGERRADVIESEIRLAKDHARVSKNPTLIAEVEAFEARFEEPVATLSNGSNVTLAELVHLCQARERRVVLDGLNQRIWLSGQPVLELTSSPGSFELLACIAQQKQMRIGIADLARATCDPKTSKATAMARVRSELERVREILPIELGQISKERSVVRWNMTHPISVATPLTGQREARLRAMLADGRASSILTIAKTIGATPRAARHLVTELRKRHVLRAFGTGKSSRYGLESGTERIVSRMLLLGLIAGG